jgi:hypothetical protein
MTLRRYWKLGLAFVNKRPVKMTGQLQIPTNDQGFQPNSARSDQHAFSMPFFP